MAKTKSKKNKSKKVAKATVSNAQFAAKNEVFLKACEAAKLAKFKIGPTVRQASKFRNKKGVVYLFKAGLIKGN